MRIGKMVIATVFLFIVSFCCACNWFSSPDRIDDIIQSGSYNFSVETWACFGHYTTIINVERARDSMKASFTHYSYGDTAQVETVPISWDKPKEKLLQNIMHEAVAAKPSKWMCTTSSTFVLNKSFYRVKATDGACAFSARLDSLLQ